MQTLLVSGFGPFDEYDRNASWEMLRDARFDPVGDCCVRTVELPVAWSEAWECLAAAWDDSVRGVLALGQADDDAFRVERFAVNAASRVAPDVRGHYLDDDWIVPGGPAALHTRLPWQRLHGALQRAGLPARVSLSAGDFVCNYLSYRLLHHVEQLRVGTVAGFVHVPALARTDSASLARARDTLVAELLEHLQQAPAVPEVSGS